MKKIFIYYSLTGNGDEVASLMKEKGYDIRKVNTLESLPNTFFLRIIVGGYKAMIDYKDKLDNFDSDISSYDEVVIGSPIWNSRLSSPINSVLNYIDLKDKKITFILYSGSGKDNKATKLLLEKYKGSKVINIREPLKNSEYKKQIL